MYIIYYKFHFFASTVADLAGIVPPKSPKTTNKKGSNCRCTFFIQNFPIGTVIFLTDVVQLQYTEVLL